MSTIYAFDNIESKHTLYRGEDCMKKFCTLLREPTLPEKEEFYSNLNMEDITDVDYMHAKRVCKNFEIKILG